MSNFNTSHKAIAQYWRDKAVSKDGHEYIDYGFPGCDEARLDQVKSVNVIYDYGEPCCFACGCSCGFENNPNYESILENKPDDVWKLPEVRKNLQRCHIIPRQFGGSDDPSNLMLLCSRCHRDSPDTRSRQMFLHWFYNRRQQPGWWHKYMLEAIQILKEDYHVVAPTFSDNILDPKYQSEHLGLHGGSISDSTIVSFLVTDALEEQKRIQEEVRVLKATYKRAG